MCFSEAFYDLSEAELEAILDDDPRKFLYALHRCGKIEKEGSH